VSIGSKQFHIKVVDLKDHPHINPMKGYHASQLKQLKSASLNLHKNATAYLLSLIIYRKMIIMANETGDLSQIDNLLTFHDTKVAHDDLVSFCSKYCHVNYSQLSDNGLSLKQLQNAYNKACGYNAGVDILYHSVEFLRFLYEVLGREGIDDSADYISLINAEGMDNAFFTPYGFWVFGTGKVQFYNMAGADVGAHEFGHRLNKAVCDQKYEKHSGGLNESFSDVMAFSYERYIYEKNVHNPEFKGSWDWFIGEDLSRDFKVRKLRDMKNPEKGLTPQPSTYRGAYWPDVNDLKRDHGGVHATSGPANRLFYLVTQLYQDDYKKALKMFYKCYQGFHSRSNYIDLRDGLLKLDPSVQGCLDQVGLTKDAVTDETSNRINAPAQCKNCPVHCGVRSQPRFPRQRFPQQQPRFPRQRFPQPFPRRFPQTFPRRIVSNIDGKNGMVNNSCCYTENDEDYYDEYCEMYRGD
jgi:hypothetical protein